MDNQNKTIVRHPSAIFNIPHYPLSIIHYPLFSDDNLPLIGGLNQPF